MRWMVLTVAVALLIGCGGEDTSAAGPESVEFELLSRGESIELKPHIRAQGLTVFDFYAGTTKRAHPIFIKLGLEWLGRSIADPKRLGKRNLIAIPTFIFNCIKLSLR